MIIKEPFLRAAGTFKNLFHYNEIGRAYFLLFFLGGIRIIFELCFGIVAMVDAQAVLRFRMSFAWSIPEYIQAGIMIYGVILALLHDLLHEKRLAQLPQMLIVEFILCHCIGFAEVLGNYLIFAIIFVLITVFVFMPICGTAGYIGNTLVLTVIPGLGAALTSAVITVGLPIVLGVLLVASVFRYLV